MMYVLGLIFMLYQESSPPPQAQPEREGESAQEILQKVAEAYRALDSYDSTTTIVINATEKEDTGTLALYGQYLSFQRSDDLLALKQSSGMGLRWEKGSLACWHPELDQCALTIEVESLSYAEIDTLSSRLQSWLSWTIPLLSMELPFLLGEDMEAIIPKARISYIDRDHPEMERYKEMARFRGITSEPGDPVAIHVLRLENDRLDLHMVIRQADFHIVGFLLKTTFEVIGGCSEEPITLVGMILTDENRVPAMKFIAPEWQVKKHLEGGVPVLIETLEDCWRELMQERKGELREQIESMREELEAMEENQSDRERYECYLERVTRFLASLDRENEPSN